MLKLMLVPLDILGDASANFKDIRCETDGGTGMQEDDSRDKLKEEN